jgi:hypothetical protein
MMETFIYVRSTELYPVYDIWFIRNEQNLLHFDAMHKLLHGMDLSLCGQANDAPMLHC